MKTKALASFGVSMAVAMFAAIVTSSLAPAIAVASEQEPGVAHPNIGYPAGGGYPPGGGYCGDYTNCPSAAVPVPGSSPNSQNCTWWCNAEVTQKVCFPVSTQSSPGCTDKSTGVNAKNHCGRKMTNGTWNIQLNECTNGTDSGQNCYRLDCT